MNYLEEESLSKEEVDIVINAACLAWDIPEGEINKKCRVPKYLMSRSLVNMYLRRVFDLKYREISEKTGTKHNSIILSIKLFENMIDSKNKEFNKRLDVFKNEIEARTGESFKLKIKRDGR